MWDDPVREKANCYAYALNCYSYYGNPHYTIGYATTGVHQSVSDMRKNLESWLATDADYFNHKTIVPTDASTKPGYRQYKIAVAFSYEGSKARDFHFFRQDKGGYWSHKRGYGGYIQNTDAGNYKIYDPRVCNRNFGSGFNYYDFAGYYMVTY